MSQVKNTEWEEIDAVSLRVGQCFQIVGNDDEDHNPFLGDTFTVASVSRNDDGSLLDNPLLEFETDSLSFVFGDGDRVLVQRTGANQ